MLPCSAANTILSALAAVVAKVTRRLASTAGLGGAVVVSRDWRRFLLHPGDEHLVDGEVSDSLARLQRTRRRRLCPRP